MGNSVADSGPTCHRCLLVMKIYPKYIPARRFGSLVVILRRGLIASAWRGATFCICYFGGSVLTSYIVTRRRGHRGPSWERRFVLN